MRLNMSAVWPLPSGYPVERAETGSAISTGDEATNGTRAQVVTATNIIIQADLR